MPDAVPIEFVLHLHGLDDDPPDLSKSTDGIQDPTSLFIEKTQFDRAMGKATDDDWDAEIGGAHMEKWQTSTLFKKGTLGYRLGITRVEEVEIDGERWVHGFDAAGELVDARVISE